MSQGRPERQITEVDGAATGRQFSAWQPLTPRGVAAFGQASGQRLLVAQLITALLMALAWLHLVFQAILPTLWLAIGNLPEEGRMENRSLVMAHPSTKPLAEGRVLGFVIDLENQSQDILASDFKIELHRRDWQICSLPGCATLDYPAGWVMALNRREAASNLQAWSPMLPVVIGVGVMVFFFAVWNVLASLYAVVPWVMAYGFHRQLSLGGAFRLASAVQLPGGLLLALAVEFYGMDWIDLYWLVILVAFHLPLTWFYLLASPLFLPRLKDLQPGSNPFGSPPADPECTGHKPVPSSSPNPFAPRPDAADEN